MVQHILIVGDRRSGKTARLQGILTSTLATGVVTADTAHGIFYRGGCRKVSEVGAVRDNCWVEFRNTLGLTGASLMSEVLAALVGAKRRGLAFIAVDGFNWVEQGIWFDVRRVLAACTAEGVPFYLTWDEETRRAPRVMADTFDVLVRVSEDDTPSLTARV